MGCILPASPVRSSSSSGIVTVAAWLVLAGALAVSGASVAQAQAPLVRDPQRFVTDVTESEAVLEAVQGSIDATLIAGLRAFDWETASEGLSAQFRGRFPDPDAGRSVGDGRLAIRRFGQDDSEPLGREAFLAVLRRHTSGWTAVERASWHAFEFLLEPVRDRAVVKAHLELGGPDPAGARSVLHATVHAVVVDAGPGRWRLDRLEDAV